ncbi:MAG: hypothetical protein H6973_03115 [Gammaproteobacteria bacterium]|nr:hypothetical protein [Gammaproteobacteria bacterium]
MIRRLFHCGLALWLWGPMSALALEVSEIQVQSALNQLFDARIPLPTLIPEDITRVSVKVASPAMFEEFGLDQTPTLEKLVFSIQYDEESRVYVKVVSTEPIREPSLALLLEFGWPRGKTFREFTVLLDPVKRLAQPAGGRTKTVLSEPRIVATRPSPPATKAEVHAAAPELPPLPVGTSSVAFTDQTSQVYGPVASGEGLWGIALKLRPEGVTREQMMQALFKANPGAFSSAGIDGLKIGAMLRVPSYREIADLTGSPIALRLAAVEESAALPLSPNPSPPKSEGSLPAESAPEPMVSKPEQEPAPTTVQTPEPEPTPVATPAPEPEPEPASVAAPEPKPEPEPASVAAPEPEPAPEPASEPASVAAQEPELEPEPASVTTHEPEPEPEPEPVQVPSPEPELASVAVLESEPAQVSEPELEPEPALETTLSEPVAIASQSDSQHLEPVSATPLLSFVAAEITTAATQTLTTMVSEQETPVMTVTDSEASTQEVAAAEVLPPVESPVAELVEEPSSESPMPESTEEPPSQPLVQASPSELPTLETVEEPLPAESPPTDSAEHASDKKPSVMESAQPSRLRYKGGDEYGPISANQRLWDVATDVRPDPSIDRDIMMKALFMANPQAFSKSSMDYLKEGAMLRIPTLREIVEYTGSSTAQQLLEKQAAPKRRKRGG